MLSFLQRQRLPRILVTSALLLVLVSASLVLATHPGQWQMSQDEPLLEPSEYPSLDFVALSDPHVIMHEGKYYLYYTGAGVTDSEPETVKTRICLAISHNGIDFQRQADVALPTGAPGTWDALNVETACVIKDGNQFKMYYMGYDTEDEHAWFAGEAITLGSIGLATSSDGLVFTRHSSEPVFRPSPPTCEDLTGVWDCWAVEGPWVIKRSANDYWMYYGASGSEDHGVTEINGIGLAYSDNGERWTREPLNPVLGGAPDQWDRYHTIDPCVIIAEDCFHLWYHGGSRSTVAGYADFHLGYAVSDDGISWSKFIGNPILTHGSETSWTAHGIMAPCVIESPSPVMYFHGLDAFPDVTTWSIGRALPRLETLTLTMSAEFFTADDHFTLDLSLENPGDAVTVDLYVILDVHGAFWSWPEWSFGVSGSRCVLEENHWSSTRLLDFLWPDDAGSLTGLAFWGALLDKNKLLSYDHLPWEFGHQ